MDRAWHPRTRLPTRQSTYSSMADYSTGGIAQPARHEHVWDFVALFWRGATSNHGWMSVSVYEPEARGAEGSDKQLTY